MIRTRDDLSLDGVQLVRLESESLRVDTAPSVGGRVVSLVDKDSGYEFLWRNQKLSLKPMEAGAEYDPNFYGGIDELFPNDVPETIDGVPCPDHGELWTLPLTRRVEGGSLKLRGTLPRFGLIYEREMSLRDDVPEVELIYRILNPTAEPRHFLWKMHAALAVQAGDIIDCPARTAQVADLNWSRYRTLEPFSWPNIQGQAANVVPAPDGTVDFFYLADLSEGRIAWRRPGQGLKFEYRFDTRIFPYAWIFASYGGFDGHYMAILEPCTCMPISVNDAAARKQCSLLQPSESIETRVSIRAERLK